MTGPRIDPDRLRALHEAKATALVRDNFGVEPRATAAIAGGAAVHDGTTVWVYVAGEPDRCLGRSMVMAERLGAGADETSADGRYWLERIECQAACTHAPVMTVDWEFMDQQTPASAVDVIDRLDRGEEVRSTRGPVIRDFQATERTLAVLDDGLADEGVGADALMLAGLEVARERGMTAPGEE